MNCSISSTKTGSLSSKKTECRELLPLVTKSLIVSAIVCALLAATGWALKLNSNALTFSFILGSGISFVGGLLGLALSVEKKPQKVSAKRFKRPVNIDPPQPKEKNLIGSQPKKVRKKPKSTVPPSVKKVPELSRETLVASLDRWVDSGDWSGKNDRITAKAEILECFDAKNKGLDLSWRKLIPFRKFKY